MAVPESEADRSPLAGIENEVSGPGRTRPALEEAPPAAFGAGVFEVGAFSAPEVSSAGAFSAPEVSSAGAFTAPEVSSAGAFTAPDRTAMLLALEEARRARDEDEVPIGAVVVLDGRVLGRGHNRTRARASPLAHAEMLALEEALRAHGDARLVGAQVFTTVEPCFMCAGALVHARVARVVWAVRDPKFGAAASLGDGAVRRAPEPSGRGRGGPPRGRGARAPPDVLSGQARGRSAPARELTTADAVLSPRAAARSTLPTERCQSG